MIDRRRQLRELYGFDFPEDFFRFWEFVNRLRPLEPLKALLDFSIHLVGPFEVLAGRFDGRTPRFSLLLHWRYHLDPPEFFTVLAGGGDGLHAGYYLDDPAEGKGFIASYFAYDAFEMTADGDTLFEAVRLSLEDHYQSCEEEPECHIDPEESMRDIDRLRQRLSEYATADRPEKGAAYTEKYRAVRLASDESLVAYTFEGMGIAVPPDRYRPLSWEDEPLWAHLYETENPIDVVEEARQALREGFPGTALKLGKDLWAIGGERHTEYAYELLDAAYAALGRDVLREVLRVHRANRDLPSVDILENEG
ncbi:MAG TPA: ADP-ribosylation family protein [Gemmataceae bacterium]|jgi:hypothetical protein